MKKYFAILFLIVVLVSPSVARAETGNKQTVEQMQALIVQLTKILNQLIVQLNEKLNNQSTTLTTIQNTQQQQTSQLQQIQQAITPAPVYIPPNPQPKTPIKFTLQSVMSECLNGPSGPNLDRYSTSPDVVSIESDSPVKGKITLTLETNNAYGQSTLVVGADNFQGISGQYYLDSKNDSYLYFGGDRKYLPIKIENAKSPIKIKVTIDSFQPEDGRAVEGLPLKFPEVQTKICN